MTQRTEKLNSVIQQQLSQIISKEIEFPNNILATITKVKCSPENKYATVFISTIPQNCRGTVLAILRKNSKNLHNLLRKNLKTKFTPNLNFQIDEQELYASEIEKLLDEI